MLGNQTTMPGKAISRAKIRKSSNKKGAAFLKMNKLDIAEMKKAFRNE